MLQARHLSLPRQPLRPPPLSLARSPQLPHQLPVRPSSEVMQVSLRSPQEEHQIQERHSLAATRRHLNRAQARRILDNLSLAEIPLPRKPIQEHQPRLLHLQLELRVPQAQQRRHPARHLHRNRVSPRSLWMRFLQRGRHHWHLTRRTSPHWLQRSANGIACSSRTAPPFHLSTVAASKPSGTAPRLRGS